MPKIKNKDFLNSMQIIWVTNLKKILKLFNFKQVIKKSIFNKCKIF